MGDSPLEFSRLADLAFHATADELEAERRGAEIRSSMRSAFAALELAAGDVIDEGWLDEAIGHLLQAGAAFRKALRR